MIINSNQRKLKSRTVCGTQSTNKNIYTENELNNGMMQTWNQSNRTVTETDNTITDRQHQTSKQSVQNWSEYMLVVCINACFIWLHNRCYTF